MRPRALVLSILLLGLASLWAQASTESSAPSTPAATPNGQASALQPAPGALPAGYGQGKKRENRLRRFEIIAFGSFPIVLFYTNLGFQLGAYAQSGFDSRYTPWPFSGELTTSISDSERFGRMGVAAGLSLAVAGIDALIVASLDRRKAAKAGPPAAGDGPAGPAGPDTAPDPAP